MKLQLFAAVKVLARGWKVEVQNNTLDFVEIRGLSSLGFDGEKNDADTTTFDNEGWQSHLVASRARSLSLEGYYLEDQTTKALDPGQELVNKLSDAIGQDSLGYFRLTSPAGTVRYFNASANVSGIGGGNDDPTGWSAELTVSGPLAMANVPVTLIDVTPSTLALDVGAVSERLTTSFTPANATNRSLTYAVTAGGAYASVTPEGRVVGLAAGSATITVTAVGGSGVTDTVTVTVS